MRKGTACQVKHAGNLRKETLPAAYALSRAREHCWAIVCDIAHKRSILELLLPPDAVLALPDAKLNQPKGVGHACCGHATRLVPRPPPALRHDSPHFKRSLLSLRESGRHFLAPPGGTMKILLYC